MRRLKLGEGGGAPLVGRGWDWVLLGKTESERATPVKYCVVSASSALYLFRCKKNQAKTETVSQITVGVCAASGTAGAGTVAAG